MKENTQNKKAEVKAEAKEEVKFQPVAIVDKVSDIEGFYKVTYKDKVKDTPEQSLRARLFKSGLIVFSNGNFSNTGNHALTISEEIKPFHVRVKKDNLKRHAKVHGTESRLLKLIEKEKVEIY